MAIDYSNLWVVCKEKGYNKTALRLKCGISTATLAKLSKDEPVSLEIIEKLCIALNCNPGDIFKVSGSADNPLLEKLKAEIRGGIRDGYFGNIACRFTAGCFAAGNVNIGEEILNPFIREEVIRGQSVNVKFEDICFADSIVKALSQAITTADDILNVRVIERISNAMGNAELPAGNVDFELLIDKYNSLNEDYYNAEAFLYKTIVAFKPFDYKADILARLIIFREALHHGIVPSVIESSKILQLNIALRKFRTEPEILTDFLREERESLDKSLTSV